MNSIKSITTVNTTAGWSVRARMQDGIELFGGMTGENGHRFTMAEAQATADSLRRDIARHGEDQVERLAALPSGVRVLRS